jgi:NYN domain
LRTITLPSVGKSSGAEQQSSNEPGSENGMRSALFVDFDNVFSGLRRLDSAVAERFAQQPLQWLRWLCEALPAPPASAPDAQRRLLVRRCYLNPQVYQRYRPAFSRAGFEIVDCPAMTSEGKTSTDIHMVLDIIDLLQHPVHYDEFMVFSADADFTPVLRKLRRWDRRTTVLAVGFPSAAYQASTDLLIDADEFIRSGLGFDEQDSPAATHNLSPRPPAADKRSNGISNAEAAIALIKDEVARAGRPVPCARLAQLISQSLPAVGADWGGKGSFRKFVDALSLAPLRVEWIAGGGLALGPDMAIPTGSRRADLERHQPSADDAGNWALICQVHAATGLPLLSSAQIGQVFDALAHDIAGTPFALSETGKRVRDLCRDAGHAVNRVEVNFVLKGVVLGGHTFGAGQDDTATLRERFVNSLMALCNREQLALDPAQQMQLRRWAGVAHPQAEPALPQQSP